MTILTAQVNVSQARRCATGYAPKAKDTHVHQIGGEKALHVRDVVWHAAADHPVLLSFPEGAYLKGLVLRVGS